MDVYLKACIEGSCRKVVEPFKWKTPQRQLAWVNIIASDWEEPLYYVASFETSITQAYRSEVTGLQIAIYRK
jgi:hypothetical protein